MLVSEVAASPTRHQDFLADFVGAFKYDDVSTTLSSRDRTHQACGASTDYYYINFLHADRIAVQTKFLRDSLRFALSGSECVPIVSASICLQ